MARSYGLGFVCFVLVVARMADAKQFKVGGANGWAVPNANAEPYNTWAERIRFRIGDQLLFVYPKDKDSVLLVESSDYNSCNTSSYVKKYDDGNTVFGLDRSGAFFFISGVEANCRNNEKLIVMVLSSRNGSASAPPTMAPSPSSSPPPISPVSPPPAGTPSPSSAPPPSSSPSPSPSAPPTSSPTPSSSPSPSTPPTPTPSSAPSSSPPATGSPPQLGPPAPPGATPPSPPSASGPSGQGTNSTASPPPPSGGASGLTAAGLVGSFGACIGYAMLAL